MIFIESNCGMAMSFLCHALQKACTNILGYRQYKVLPWNGKAISSPSDEKQSNPRKEHLSKALKLKFTRSWRACNIPTLDVQAVRNMYAQGTLT